LRFESFNEDYVRRLTDGDPDAGEHFVAYFSSLLLLKLRVRLCPINLIEDVRQETLARVLTILRRGEGVIRPERFGAFVNGVCVNVMREFRRLDERAEAWDDDNIEEPVDPRVDLEADLVNADSKRVIERVFAMLQEKDRRILQAIYLDEISKPEVCRMFNVNACYMRVLLCRAKEQFRNAYRNGGVDGHGETAP
jgi:RNA polymerase sigma factor (sigma-70 family)